MTPLQDRPGSPATGFEGGISGLGLADLLQLKAQHRFSGCFRIQYQSEQGRIFFREGEIVHAEQGALSGEAAFCEMLSQRLQAVVRPFLFEPATYEEIVKLVWESQKTPIDDIENFITTAKTYNFSPEVIRSKLEGAQWSCKQRAFGNLALNVFEAYQTQLHKLGKIDFEDMINEAIVALENSPELCKDVYDHILVDFHASGLRRVLASGIGRGSGRAKSLFTIKSHENT